MADHYYYICTSDEYKHVSGQLINHKSEIVHPSSSEKGITQLKNIFGSRSFPQYAIDAQNVDKIWRLSVALTES